MIKSYFFNAEKQPDGSFDRVYNAESFSDWLKLIIANGVFSNPSTNLQVEARSGFNIVVDSGSGWIDGHKMDNTIYYPLTIDGSDVLLDRIDRVIFYLDYTNRVMGIDVLKGEAAQYPEPPALTRDDERVEYCLAEISIAHQATEITQADITDTRANTSICGWVSSLIEQVDTETLFIQWQTAYENAFSQLETWQTQVEDDFDVWAAAEKAAFDTFIEHLTQELKVDTYIEEYKKAVSLTSGGSTAITLDMTGYTYAAADIVDVFINGLVGVAGTDYTLSESGGVATVTLALTLQSGITDDIVVRVLKSKIGYRQT